MNSEANIYKVVISQNAANMLLAHISFLAQVSNEAAEKLRLEFVEAVNSLETYPERNPYLTDPIIPMNKYHKMLVSKLYLFIYQISGVNVYVDYIVDCRQDYKWLLE